MANTWIKQGIGLPQARITSREETPLSPWVCVVTKEVEFAPGQPAETYHCLAQPDYVVILARTPNGFIPLVRQYRPAVETYTLELPAGLLDDNEKPEDTCRRELYEETGLNASEIIHLGSYYIDTGRMENRLHAFYVLTNSDPEPDFVPEEAGLAVEFVDMQILRDYILSGKFIHQLHLGLLTLAALRGIKI